MSWKDIAFDGTDYQPDRDYTRLTTQREKVFDFMSDGQWHTLNEIHSHTGAPEASASAALRDFRKVKHGSHTVDKRYVGSGLYEYKLVTNKGDEPQLDLAL
jgi:hypothetical protein